MTVLQIRRRHELRSPGGTFEVSVDESGARIASVVHVPSGTEFLLRMPDRDEEDPTTPAAVASNVLWHERFAGGWHTLLPHAGDARTVDGVDHAFHGEAAWRLWRTIAEDDSGCTLEVHLKTVALTLQRRTEATEDGVRVHQRVINTSDRDVSFSWTEHPSLGEALVDPRARLSVDQKALDIELPATNERHSGFRSMPVTGRGVARLSGPEWDAALCWDPALFPYLHIWQEHRQTQGFPWWGRVSTIALEPASRPYESHGGALGPITLNPGAQIEAVFVLSFTPPDEEDPTP